MKNNDLTEKEIFILNSFKGDENCQIPFPIPKMVISLHDKGLVEYGSRASESIACFISERGKKVIF